MVERLQAPSAETPPAGPGGEILSDLELELAAGAAGALLELGTDLEVAAGRPQLEHGASPAAEGDMSRKAAAVPPEPEMPLDRKQPRRARGTTGTGARKQGRKRLPAKAAPPDAGDEAARSAAGGRLTAEATHTDPQPTTEPTPQPTREPTPQPTREPSPDPAPTPEPAIEPPTPPASVPATEPRSDPMAELAAAPGQSLEVLRREKELAEITLASIGDGVIRTDREGRIDYLNPVAEALTGWSSTAARGRPASEVFHLVDETLRAPLPDPVARCLEERRVVVTDGHAQLLSADGREFAVRDSAAPIYGADGQPLGAVLVFKDVTELRGMEREMMFLATHDALTGLINRREFESHLKRAIRSSRAERRQHTLLYLDLDEFKIVNDTCGHLVGDEMLKQVSALLQARVRRSDVLARLGGDEFGLLLEDCPIGLARQRAEEMRRSLREFRFSWRGQIFEVGGSIGLVPITAGSGDLAQVMSAADAACYVAKDGGRNRVHEYEPDDTLVAERYGEMQWVHRIHGAFEERRFRLFYQLIQPLGPRADEREMLCELFLRMLDRKGQVIEPAAFIAAAERFHLAATLDRWVVATALGALAEAQRGVSRPVLFCINLSGQSVSDAGFLAFVQAELDRRAIDPRRIAFEITETAAISKLDSAMHFIRTLKDKGCRFILDDFGTGLSSFAYLRDLAVDFLKIDGEFVRNMVDDRVKRAMVESINQIGHVMEIQTIAEWVENRSTFDAIKEMGVDYGQGFWLCRPQPLIHDP